MNSAIAARARPDARRAVSHSPAQNRQARPPSLIISRRVANRSSVIARDGPAEDHSGAVQAACRGSRVNAAHSCSSRNSPAAVMKGAP